MLEINLTQTPVVFTGGMSAQKRNNNCRLHAGCALQEIGMEDQASAAEF